MSNCQTNLREKTVEYINSNDFAAARANCDEWLREEPMNAQAWHLLGVCHAREGELHEAIECFAKATEFDLGNSLYPYNLAVAQKSVGKLDQAIANYELAIDRRSDFFAARINLGVALLEAERNKEALECFQATVDQFPDSPDANFNLANSLAEAGRIDEAALHYRRTIERDPSSSAAYENLGRAFVDAERFDDAKEVWQQWLLADPNNATANHMLASISDAPPPPRCLDQCIQETFDESFAATFDRQLARLDYQSPQCIADAFGKFELPKNHVDVLDCGCGTGLCGPHLRPSATKMIGVDLSKAMLDQAAKRNLYDELHEDEITRFMASHPSTFDFIVAADTLCYFGVLHDVLGAAFDCLKPSGRILFTLESMEDSRHKTVGPNTGYGLCPHGRYVHQRDYIAEAATMAGLEILEIRKMVQRNEAGRPVQGWLVTAQKIAT
ncbi:TPR repeat-containing protein YrrB [Novipirellula aureliae]|uniref:TPR repeat-containing protein YrrB n=1 Tax=Novipirellula aureliae TaxID=2527966 RepID=A0A5C6E169_9BACT|nr:tetratricopeptide repeat protein [Novipirellula aureliae]TWU41401.1 TPR repeat-containing protein YrrB [Novipirellula aureliae]